MYMYQSFFNQLLNYKLTIDQMHDDVIFRKLFVQVIDINLRGGGAPV